MPQEEAAPMPPEGGAPMPQTDPRAFSPSRGGPRPNLPADRPELDPSLPFNTGGFVGYELGGGVTPQASQSPSFSEDTFRLALMSSPPKTSSPLSTTRVNPLAPGAQNLPNPNTRMANMGGFIPYSRNG